MKRILFCLLLGTSASAGCITFPKGVHPWQHTSPSEENVSKQGKPEPPPPPRVVKPDEVNEQNYREKTRLLEAEIRREEQGK